MELLVAAANDQSGEAVRLIVILLLVVAGCLAGLTAWYWRYTDPRRRDTATSVQPAESDRPEAKPNLDQLPLLAASSYVPAVTGQMPAVQLPAPPPTRTAPSVELPAPASGLLSPDGTGFAVVEKPEPDEPDAIVDGLSDKGDEGDRELDPQDDFVIVDAAKTGEINLTDAQWDQLAEAVLGAIGWGETDPSENVGVSEQQPPVDERVRAVGAVD